MGVPAMDGTAWTSLSIKGNIAKPGGASQEVFLSTDTRPDDQIESLPEFLSAQPADGVELTLQVQDDGLVALGSPTSLKDFSWSSAWFTGSIFLIAGLLVTSISPLVFVFWIPGALMVVFILLTRFWKCAYFLDLNDRTIVYRRTFLGLKKTERMDLDQVLCVVVNRR